MQIMEGKHGSLQVRDLGNDLDSAGLFYKCLPYEHYLEPDFQLIAMHPNGFSCHALSERILKAWESPTTELADHAVAQAQYILDCGGMTIHLKRIHNIALPEES